MIGPARLAWAADGTPRSDDYDDVYYSRAGGLAQARHVFIAGNELPQRWQDRPHLTILETGFGLGLNFLATWQAWRADPQRCARLHFVSAELHPLARADLAALHAQWPELAELAAELQRNWPPPTPGFHHLLLDAGRVALTLLFGDAHPMLEQLRGRVDAIYLDGFAPQKNPQLWSPELLRLLTRHAAPDATLASWCVAGEVRHALADCGWQVRKRPGLAPKWHMLSATRPGTPDNASQASGTDATTATATAAADDAIVIGAGIAGCSAVEALARRGWQVTLLERHPEPAQEASGNPAGLLHPMLAKDDNLAARFSRAAYLYSLRLLDHLGHDALAWQRCGILQLAADEADALAQRAACRDFPADYVSWLDQTAASDRAGLPVAAGGWWFPHGAWVSPPDFCRALLAAAGTRVRTHYASPVAAIRHADGRWHACAADGRTLASASHLVLANAVAAGDLLPELHLTLRSIRGQLSYLPPATLDGLQTALCGAGYAIRTETLGVIGASFVEQDADTTLRAAEHADNLAKLARMLPGLALPAAAAAAGLSGRVAFRTASHDRLPLVGPLPQAQLKVQHTLASLPRQPGLHALLGFGARGLAWAPLAAEVLAAQLAGEVLPLERTLLAALDPARHHLRWLRRKHNTSDPAA